LQLVVAAFDGPKIHGEPGQFIDFGNRCEIALQVYNVEVALAGFACEQTHVGKIGSGETRDVGFRGLATTRTLCAGKRSSTQAQRTNQFERETIPLRVETSCLRRLDAPRAIQPFGEARRIWLQRGASI